MGSLFSTPKVPDPPAPAKPTPMADPADTTAAKKREQMRAMSRTGRESTILSAGSDKLGA